ncbi:unnamed protein product [Gordionus sp. m RMFG-2023]
MNTYYVNLKSSILQINEAQKGTALACAWTELANRKEELVRNGQPPNQPTINVQPSFHRSRMNVQQLFNRPIFRLTCFACGTEGHKAANSPSNTYVINNNDNNQNKVFNDSNFAHSNTILDRSNVILGPKQVLLKHVLNNRKNFGVHKTLMKKPILQRKRPDSFSIKMNVAEEVQQEFAEMGITEVNE